jgi:hypothetical protein
MGVTDGICQIKEGLCSTFPSNNVTSKNQII